MFTNSSYRLGIVFVVLAALALVVIGGCSSSSKKDTTTPVGSTLTMTVSPTTVTQGNTSIIEVTVSSGGTGIANQIVTFLVTPSNAGYFSPAMDTTDATGAAATVFTATTIGNANLTANVNNGALTRTVGLAISAQQQTGSGNINIGLTPSLLLANGSDTASVHITVRDALGQPAPDSTAVRLVAGEKFVDKDGNGYWSSGIDSLVFDANNNGRWDALGLVPSTAYTSGGTGTVTVNYISGNDALTVYVKATVNDNGITGYAEAPLQLSPNASVNSIYLASDTMNLSVKQTGGIETGQLRAVCFDINGNTVPEGLAVNFIITDGPNGGEHLSNVGYGPFQAITNSQGQAVVPIHSGTKSGTVRIRAYVDTVLSNASQVMISAGPPAYIVVGADTCNVGFWNVVAGLNKIEAIVSDVYLNPVNDSTVVYFSCDEGTMVSHEKRTVDHNGIAETEWYSNNNVVTADGRVIIRAETSGGTVKDSSMFYNTGAAASVIVPFCPTHISADGKSKFNVVVEAYDGNNNPMVNGTPLKALATYLQTKDGVLSDGCNSSAAVMEVGSATLDMDYSTTGGNDDGVGAIDNLIFRCGYSTHLVVCSLLTGNTYSGNSALNGSSTVDTGKTIDLSVKVKDRWSNPLGDHTMVMTATGGTVIGASHKTDAYGEAFGYKWRAPASGGVQTISVTDTDPRGGGVVLTLNVTVTIPQ
jgi:hypothetical protein